MRVIVNAGGILNVERYRMHMLAMLERAIGIDTEFQFARSLLTGKGIARAVLLTVPVCMKDIVVPPFIGYVIIFLEESQRHRHLCADLDSYLDRIHALIIELVDCRINVVVRHLLAVSGVKSCESGQAVP